MRSKNSKAITKAEAAHLARAKVLGWHERRFEFRHGAEHRPCETCGRSLWLPKSKVAMYRTCGGECAVAMKRAPVLARQKPCEKCGTLFVPRTTQLRAGHGRFCSQSCNEAAHTAIQRPEVRKKGTETRSANKDQWAWKVRGELSPCWTGGRKATYERRKEAGFIRDQNNKRRDFRRKSLPKGAIPMLETLQRMKCANCRACLRGGYHLDHILPISRGGAHEIGNVQLLCPPCNRKKRDRLPTEWADMNGRLL